MPGFLLKTSDNKTIRFRYYNDAPVTRLAMQEQMPFKRVFKQARVSGEEIWTEDAPVIDILQENSTVFAKPGEIAIGPLYPERNKVAKCMGIFYGEGKLLDAANIFAVVYDEDLPLLKELGERIWNKGAEELHFESM